jgi:hypothetical protein
MNDDDEQQRGNHARNKVDEQIGIVVTSCLSSKPLTHLTGQSASSRASEPASPGTNFIRLFLAVRKKKKKKDPLVLFSSTLTLSERSHHDRRPGVKRC